jgi:ribosome-binding protein aMBF1 (putative translation factor)
MKLSDMKSLDQIIDEDRRGEPDYRREWDRTALAREIALAIVRYRTKHGLSQRDLARETGITQPAIARLESGEHTPSLSTLVKLTTHTGMQFRLDVHDGSAELVTV